MGFNMVHRSLVELFPQVDPRILKAVAIENAKDLEGAVDAILTDVVPYIRQHDTSPFSYGNKDGNKSKEVNGDGSIQTMADAIGATGNDHGQIHGNKECPEAMACALVISAAENNGADTSLGNDQSLNSKCIFPVHSYQMYSSLSDIEGKEKTLDYGRSVDIAFLNMEDYATGVVGCSLPPEVDHGDDNLPKATEGISENNVDLHKSFGKSTFFTQPGQVHGTVILKQTIEEAKNHKVDGNMEGPGAMSYASVTTSLAEDSGVDTCLSSDLGLNSKCSVPVRSYQMYSSLLSTTGKEETCDHGRSMDHALMVTEDNASVLGCSVPPQVDQEGDNSPKVEEGATESTLDLLTQSEEVHGMDILEQLIEDAKSHKKSLDCAMESVTVLMREVRLKEKSLEQVKEVAAKGGLDILVEVEELRRMLVHAKETNDMHAGEVYGEKAILTTEMKELQSRLLGMAVERDESLSILNEMRQALEARIYALQEEIRAAEQEKLDKEESAKVALAEQKVIMEKVVAESKILQQEAEENAKMRNSLMDRGRVVDMLQGELAVICQDMKLLKERFDNGIPLSDSLTFNQIGSFLASSRSSTMSITSDQCTGLSKSSLVSQQYTKAMILQSAETTISRHDSETIPSGDSLFAVNGVKDLLDDDWELFDTATQ